MARTGTRPDRNPSLSKETPMFDLRKWFRKTFRIDARFASRSQSVRRRKTLLQLEQLEDRTVPTVVFQPHFSGERVTTGSVKDGMTSPPVELIFWGNFSTDQVFQLGNLAGTVLSSPYLSSLQQYG